MFKSLVQSVSTYESGNAVDTEGRVTIRLWNKNVSGTYSNSREGVTPSILQESGILLGGCLTVKNWCELLTGDDSSFLFHTMSGSHRYRL